MPQIKILFFTSNLKRTGAEVVLFNLVCRLDPILFQIGLVLTTDEGELVHDLPPHVTLYRLKTKYNLIDKIKHNLGSDLLFNQLQSIQNKNNYGIWYINSLSPAYVLKYANLFNVKTVCHIHEISSNYSYLSSINFKFILNSNLIIACSQIVYNEIINVYGGQIEVINSAIDTNYIDSFNLKKSNKAKELQIICAGSISDRKGTDIFIQVANMLQDKKIKFIWLGKYSDNGFSYWIKKTLEKTNLPNVEFINPNTQLEYYSYLNDADYYFATSREESLGLAMMEAVHLGIPVVALNSGGPSLFINESNGILIDSYNINEVSKHLYKFVSKHEDGKNFESNKNSLKDFNLSQEYTKWQRLLCQLVP